MCNDCTKCKSFGKLPKITSAFFILTERCNLACEYCFVHQNPREMTLDIAMKAVEFLIKNAEEQGDTPSINFFGGEPLLKWNQIIVPVVKYIREELKIPFKLSLTSNGLLLTRDKLEFMKKYNMGLLFSIDGAKETQDKNRPLHNGQGSFDLLEEKIPMILEYYPSMTFRATISNKTVEHTFENMKFAVDQGYNNMFFIPNVFAEWTNEQKEELRKQIRLWGDYFIENARQGRIIKLNNFDEQIAKIEKINNAHAKGIHRDSTITAKGKCGLGSNKFASVGTDGTLFGCQEMTSNQTCGNVFIIGDIFNGEDEEKRLKLMSKFQREKIQGLNCDTCKLNNICDGGCVANNYIQNGDINKMPEMLCFYYQLLLEEGIRVCKILGEERNQTFKDYFFSKNRRR